MDITEMDLLLRALASPSRLDLLNVLLKAPLQLPPETPGTTPTELAARLALSRSAVSHHLKILLRMRLIRYWKKGVHKFYTPSRPRSGSIRERLLVGLGESLPPAEPATRRKPGPGRGKAVRPARHRDVAKSPMAEVWSAVTVCSNFRRILMLKALLQSGGASRADLVRATGLDRKTVKYHVSKLVRRGVLAEEGASLTVCAKPPTRLHGLMLALISGPAAGPLSSR